MFGSEEQGSTRKRRYALVGVAALAVLLICVGALAAQRPQEESVDRHEQLARLGLEDDVAKPPAKPPKPPVPPKKLPPGLLRRRRCRRAAAGVAIRLSAVGKLCARLGKRPVNKKRCIRAIKNAISFPFVHVVDEPKEFARGRKPVTTVFDCAEDVFKFAMGKPVGKPKKRIRVGWSFGPKPFRVFASACSAKGVSAFLRPRTQVVKMQGKVIKIIGKDMAVKVDTKPVLVRVGRRRRRVLKVSKMVILGIADVRSIRRRRGPKGDMEEIVDVEEEDGMEFEEDQDEEDYEME